MAEPAPDFSQFQQGLEEGQAGWTPHVVHDLPPGGRQAWEEEVKPMGRVVHLNGEKTKELGHEALHWAARASSEDLAAYHRTRPTHYTRSYPSF